MVRLIFHFCRCSGLEIDGSQVRRVSDVYRLRQRVWDVKRFHTGAAGITGDAERSLLEVLAGHLAATLRDAIESCVRAPADGPVQGASPRRTALGREASSQPRACSPTRTITRSRDGTM